MKKFIYTVAGKTTLFISCIICILTLTLSIIGAIYMMGHGYYTSPKSEIFGNVARNEIYSDAYRIVANHLNRGTDIGFDDSNILYTLTDEKGNVVEKSNDLTNATENTYTEVFGILKDGEKVTDIFPHYEYTVYDKEAEYYAVEISFEKGFPKSDVYSLINSFINITYALRYSVFFIALIIFACIIICFIALMCVSARRPDSDNLYPGFANKIPFDLLLVTSAITVFALIDIFLIDSIYDFNLIILIASIFIFSNIFLGLCMSIAARLKQQTLLKNTIIYRILKLIVYFFRAIGGFLIKIPLVWRTAFAVAAISAIEFFTIALNYYEPDNLMIFWFAEKIMLIPVILYIAMMIKHLFRLGSNLANGKTDCKANTHKMVFDFKKHGENLNDIANGINIAVNEKLKSERLKTELITNVSHDIKTPLTSVINYSTLIGQEKCDNPKIEEYASVLVRQSERLKRLIDDIVEASKASSGNLDIDMKRCDGTVFITQSAGEYSDKFESRGLKLVTKYPDSPTWIMADGRRMWRIFDNLLNNVFKYAQSGTRVYITLETTADKAVFSFKNTSANELDITEEELMERFVRGDKSRTAEGNGLGLSIAKSLAELQGGNLNICIDGDLFKATLSFPKI